MRTRKLGLLVVAGVSLGVSGLAGPASASDAWVPPVGRAYELVSPVDDASGNPAGVASDAFPMPAYVSPTGDALAYGAPGSIGVAFGGPPNPFIFGRRDPVSGWSAETVPRTADGGQSRLNFSGGEMVGSWFSIDADAAVFGMSDRLVPGTGTASYHVERRNPMPLLVDGSTRNVVAASADLRTLIHSVFEEGSFHLYAVRDGVRELAGVLPGGEVAPMGELANGIGTMLATALPALRYQNMLTPDGRYVLFVSGPGGTTNETSLYVRDLHEKTTRALAELPNGVGPLAANFGPPSQTLNAVRFGIHHGFVSAAAKAPVAFFRGTASVVNPPYRIFEADLSTGQTQYRSGITGPPVRVSDDGTKVMFVTVPPSNTTDPFEIRVWDREDPDSSVLLGSVPKTNNSATSGGVIRFARSVNEGQTWVFGASGTLDPDRPNVRPTALQVYRWNVGDDHPTCLSCSPVDGQGRFAGINMGVSESSVFETARRPTGALNGGVRAWQSAMTTRSASDDGRIVAFDSPDRLVAADTNEHRDVYLWDADAPSGQELQLLTSGKGEVPSYFLGLDSDGRNVFFSTADGLIEADKDLTYDVYTARVGGGFPFQPQPCSGESCRPPVIAPRESVLPTSTTTTPAAPGASKPPQAGKPRFRVASVRSSASRVRVRVAVPKAGRITVSGARVRSTARSINRPTDANLRVPLNAAARRAVRTGRTVKVALKVSFRPRGGGAATTVRTSISVRKGR